MASKYDDAVTALYRAPLDKFVVERKRLASELKTAGDKAGATRLAGLARPPISAWVVNQLWWEARETFDELFAAGERLRAGDLDATSTHRDAITKLRARAETLLSAAGNAGTEATLRRIATDLSALAAMGTFDPDPPGALAGDREPPGFDFVGVVAPEATQRVNDDRPPIPKDEKGGRNADAKAREEVDAARRRQEREERERLEQERRKAEEERARKREERERAQTALDNARTELDARTKEVERLRSELAEAEKAVDRMQGDVAELKARLRGLD